MKVKNMCTENHPVPLDRQILNVTVLLNQRRKLLGKYLPFSKESYSLKMA